MSIKIVGLSGKMGAGKDYIANTYFIPWGYKKFSFAWPLKTQLISDGIGTYEELFKTKPQHIRNDMQEIAERRKVERRQNNNVWIDHAFAWMTVLHEEWRIDKFVIADVRFTYEADYIKSVGGKVIRVISPHRTLDMYSKYTINEQTHVSEGHLDSYTKFDNYIFNDIVANEVSLEGQMFEIKKLLGE